jgi:hypothetical protein
VRRRRGRSSGLVLVVAFGIALIVSAGGAAAWTSAAARDEQAAYAEAKRRYIAAVDAVCLAATVKTTAEEAPPTTTREEVDELAQAARGMARTVAEIEAISPPRRDAERIRHGLLAPARRLVAELRHFAAEAEEAVSAGRTAEARELVDRSLRPNPDELALRTFAEQYGFTTCAGQ